MVRESANLRASEDDVLQHTVTVNYSGHPHAIHYQPAPENLAQRE
ncbi:hypothetical protein [Streptomyces sp. NPDC051572]